MKNNRNFLFPSNETCKAASMSSRSKMGAKMEAVVDGSDDLSRKNKHTKERTQCLCVRLRIGRAGNLESRKAFLWALACNFSRLPAL